MDTGEKIMTDIIEVCLETDLLAAKLYERLAAASEIEELKRFWHEMAEEENVHVSFWKPLLKMSKQGHVPSIFEDPDATKAELEKDYEKVSALWKSYKSDPNVSNMFLLAYKMEFYLLHPAFEMLFQYMKKIVGDMETPEDEYERHLLRFIDMFSKYADMTPELELLGQTLQALWRENRKLATQCFMDDLTRVYNRRGFFQTIKPLLHLAKRSNQPVGVLMADIDDFKQVNDTYGHQRGDEVLRAVGAEIASRLRASDVAGRYGGEEFAVLISNVSERELETIAEDIRKRVESKSFSGLSVSISIGIASATLSGDVDKEILALLKIADDRLYQAKRSGKNQVSLSC